MDNEQLKQGILELLNADTEKGKMWFFPSNVSESHTVLLGLNLKQTLKAVGFSILSLVVTVLLFRSKAILAMILYLFIILVTFGSMWAYYIIKPITDRPNISISNFLKQRKQFSKRQKVFFKRPQERV